MNYKNIKNTLLLAAVSVVVGTGCRKKDFNINTNPDAFTESTVPYRSVFPPAVQNTARIVATDWKWLQNYLGYWARSGSFQDITDEESYSFSNDFNVGIWNDLYNNVTNYAFVQKKAKDAGAGFYEAIARIMKAHSFQILVDVYGNVPYFGALQGNENRTPTYDNGLDIYKDLLKEMDAAIALLKDPAMNNADKNPELAANDLVFAGNATNWIRLANTLKLRMLIHCYQVPGFDITGEIAKITAEGTGYLQAGQNAQINPGFSASKPNPYYRVFVASETGSATTNSSMVKANAYAVGPYASAYSTYGWYSWDGDPRIDRFYTKPSGATAHRGIKYGEISGTDPNNVGEKLSGVNGPGLIPNGASSRAWIVTGFESLFLQAEARARGWITGPTAATLLRDAVRESFVFLGLTTAQADAYITGNATYSDVDITATPPAGQPTGGVYTILCQKWFAFNAIAPFEVWTDYRRTDVVYGIGGDFAPGPPISVNPNKPASVTKIPVRLYYPQSEFNYNAANVPQGINVFTSKVFWDLN